MKGALVASCVALALALAGPGLAASPQDRLSDLLDSFIRTSAFPERRPP